MAAIELSHPKKGIDIDCFRIEFDVSQGSVRNEEPPYLTVTIQDKYPEINTAIIPDPPPPGAIIIPGVTLQITDREGDNAIATLTLPEDWDDISDAPTNTDTGGDETNYTTNGRPNLKFRQFYYRLTSDEILLENYKYPDSDLKDIREVFNPSNYRVRLLNENGLAKVIYRFDIIVDNSENGQVELSKNFFPGNNLLEILLKDENKKELLLCSAELEVENGNFTTSSKSVSVISNTRNKNSPGDTGDSGWTSEGSVEKPENSKAFKKRNPN